MFLSKVNNARDKVMHNGKSDCLLLKREKNVYERARMTTDDQGTSVAIRLNRVQIM